MTKTLFMCHFVANYFKFDSRSAVVPSSATASASFVCNKMATFTGAERARCVLLFHETNSATSVQSRFRTEYGRDPPSRPPSYSWHKNFVKRNRQVAHRLVMLLSNRSGKTLPVVLQNQRGVQLWRQEFHKRQFSKCYGDNCLIPQIDEDEQQDSPFYYQQDGAPPHTDVRDFLNGRFPGRWIGHWPCTTSFPRFDSYGFFLWGFIKDNVYVPPLPASLADLRRITAAVAEVKPDLLERVWREIDYRKSRSPSGMCTLCGAAWWRLNGHAEIVVDYYCLAHEPVIADHNHGRAGLSTLRYRRRGGLTCGRETHTSSTVVSVIRVGDTKRDSPF
ncbi:hypothetical protein J6590_039224 [Homalodisca vitripennis]|nr:hypothetical protein J6590_039224 [Homalodisca vitripennis]